MASREETFTARIFVNDEEARKRLDGLVKKADDLRKKKLEAARAASKSGDWGEFNKLKKELDSTVKEIDSLRNSSQKVSRVLGDLSNSSMKELTQAARALNKELSSGAVKRGTEEYKFLVESLRKVNTEIALLRDTTKPTMTVFQRFTKFLNDSWGGLAMVGSSIAGLSMTIRKTVQDYAKMEEAMADTRKYTGLTDAAVRDLNEELKGMNTRTSREELNELAGAAGRLGKTSKDDIMDFVKAGNMIKVALGDDLGEGAIDNVGKLAMAFGEDKEKGLRGAMLSTGSAINELAQNSSAQAGYLVDFTARVAGFGKQIGLTQAQIMGFGAVMDENLLRDEMAATAFGNMLTKMQTDTEKFARIAGKSVEDFTQLLSRDANAAILAVADSLKRQDPTTMMKMLDDMGLDGSRAVGVLSTLADKIDDVRKRQKLATEAYEEGTSVEREYNTMNNTVQAGIDKAKKEFLEMSIALGEQLQPMVKYTISGFALMVKGLYVLTKFVTENGKALAILASEVAIVSAVYGAATIKTKVLAAAMAVKAGITKGLTALTYAWRVSVLVANVAIAVLTGNITKAAAAMATLNTVTKSNPYTALVAVVLALGTAIYALVDRFRSSSKEAGGLSEKLRALRAEHEMLKGVNEEANKSVSEEITRFRQLRKQLEDNKTKLEERKKALKEIKKIAPEYHGRLTAENKLINSNTAALDGYVTNLMKAARAQAAFNRMVQLQGSSMAHEQRLTERQGNRQYALNQLSQLGATEDSSFHHLGYGNYQMFDKDGKLVKMVTQEEKKRIEQYQDLVKYNDKRIAQEKAVLAVEQKQSETLQKMVDANGGYKEPTADNTPTGDYVTAADEKKNAARAKKAEDEKKKQLAEEKKRLKERADAAKASWQEQLAEEMLAYRQGITTYGDYMKERHNLTQGYYDQLKRIYGEDSNEYKKALLQKEQDEQEYTGWKTKQAEEDLVREKMEREHHIRMEFARQTVQDERVLEEQLFRSDREYLQKKASLYKEGSKERIEIEDEIVQMDRDRQFQLEMDWMQRLSQYRQDAGRMDYQALQKMEEEGVKTFYGSLVREGKMAKDEYDAILDHIRRRYAEMDAEQAAGNDVRDKASKSLETARRNAGARDVDAGGDAATGIFSVMQVLEQQKAVNERLKEMYGEDYENNREYQEAKRQLNAETMQSIVAGAQAAYSTISTFMSAASNYAKACSNLEVAQIEKNYDRQIEAAGNNTRKKERLEKKKDKAIAKAKTEANKKAMAMEIAQAVAQTAMGAISAYSTTMAGAPYPANLVLAPISAGIALAAGALQIATIKKQHQAESAGYYEGGFTGGRNYRREAGVVHEGEFVANHKTVQNRQLVPMLQLIDQAQRNNRMASLTADDVIRSMGGGAAAVVAPTVNMQTNNERLEKGIEDMNEGTKRLVDVLEDGIDIIFPMETFDRRYKHYNKLRNRG